MEVFATIALVVINTIEIVLFIYVLTSWFMSPYHPIRQGLGRIIEPFLAPIRNIMPQTGMMDLSPIVLFIILYILSSLIQTMV